MQKHDGGGASSCLRVLLPIAAAFEDRYCERNRRGDHEAAYQKNASPSRWQSGHRSLRLLPHSLRVPEHEPPEPAPRLRAPQPLPRHPAHRQRQHQRHPPPVVRNVRRPERRSHKDRRERRQRQHPRPRHRPQPPQHPPEPQREHHERGDPHLPRVPRAAHHPRRRCQRDKTQPPPPRQRERQRQQHPRQPEARRVGQPALHLSRRCRFHPRSIADPRTVGENARDPRRSAVSATARPADRAAGRGWSGSGGAH